MTIKHKRPYTLFWLGIAAFVVVALLAMPLTITAVPGGLGDHQAALTGADVDRIQNAWRTAGVEGMARATMIADLIFIGIFAIGAFLAGRHLWRLGSGFVRWCGLAAMVGAVIFGVTDYAETISETVELFRFAGDDTLAGIASTARPIKMVAFFVALVPVLIGMLVRRISPPAA